MIYRYKDPDELHMDMDIWEDARQQALKNHNYKEVSHTKQQIKNIQNSEIRENENEYSYE